MKLVRINHIRCDEYDAITYMMAPDEWSKEDIHSAIDRAQSKYLDALKRANVTKPIPPNDYKEYTGPPYGNFPDLTVKEVQEEWDRKKEEYMKWKNSRIGIKKSVTNFLQDEGFTHLYDDKSAVEATMDWGHRHGSRIEYEETKTNTFPTPNELATGKKEEHPFGV
jgi:hypothetical protein